MRRRRLAARHAGEVLILAALLSVPAWAANPAQPGTINYIEGQVSIGARTLDRNAAGSVDLDTGQTLTTANGKAEILLTPGVFLRVDDHSSATMASPTLTDTEVRLVKGRAMIEADNIHRENNIRIAEDGATARLVKNGLYDFNANFGIIRVFDGQVIVQEQDQQIKVKGGHEVNLTTPPKAQKFERESAKDAFYNWSSLRSDYLAEANAEAARYYYVDGMGWPGPGWYWDPWFGAYTFLPGQGLLHSPFGWTFYSPWWSFDVPFIYSGRTYHHFNPAFEGRGSIVPPNRALRPTMRQPPMPMIGGLHPGMRSGGWLGRGSYGRGARH